MTIPFLIVVLKVLRDNDGNPLSPPDATKYAAILVICASLRPADLCFQ